MKVTITNPVPQPPPPAVVTVEMSLEDARILARMTHLNDTIPSTVMNKGFDTHGWSDFLRRMNAALINGGIR